MSINVPVDETENTYVYEVDNTQVGMSKSTGYINGTAICQATDKRINNYLRNDTTISFMMAVAEGENIAIENLAIVKKGGPPQEQGTWVHPLVAINLAQWASASFAYAVSKWVNDWTSSSIKPNIHADALFETPATIRASESVTSSLLDLQPYLQALNQVSVIYSHIISGYKEEKALTNIQDKTSLIELRLNLTDLTLLSLSNVRKILSPLSTPLTLNQVTSTIASYPSNSQRTENDMVSVNQRHKELFLLGQIPRELMYEEICSIGAKASKSYRFTYNSYPSKIKQITEFGVTRVNCYKRSNLPSIVDVHIYNLFGILSVIDKTLYDASVI